MGGDLAVWESPTVAELDLPALEHVGGDLHLYDVPAVERLDGLPVLVDIGGTLRLIRLAGLRAVALPSLREAGGLYLYDDPVLEGLTSRASAPTRCIASTP